MPPQRRIFGGGHGVSDICFELPAPSALLKHVSSYCPRNFTRLTQVSESKTLGLEYASRKGAKDAKFGNIYFLFFATLAFFARDIPDFGCVPTALDRSWWETISVLFLGYVWPSLVPVCRALECRRGVQDRLIGEPLADELHSDRQAFRTYPAGQRTAG